MSMSLCYDAWLNESMQYNSQDNDFNQFAAAETLSLFGLTNAFKFVS